MTKTLVGAAPDEPDDGSGEGPGVDPGLVSETRVFRVGNVNGLLRRILTVQGDLVRVAVEALPGHELPLQLFDHLELFNRGLAAEIPLAVLVKLFMGLVFEPCGVSGNPDLRYVSSPTDYIVRQLALDHLPFDERAKLGVLTVEERLQSVPELSDPLTEPGEPEQTRPDPDAQYCYICGVVMQRAGACFVCSSCGTTSGCS